MISTGIFDKIRIFASFLSEWLQGHLPNLSKTQNFEGLGYLIKNLYKGVIHKSCGHGRGRWLAKCPYYYIFSKWSTFGAGRGSKYPKTDHVVSGCPQMGKSRLKIVFNS